jgi:hypothetical protein
MTRITPHRIAAAAAVAAFLTTGAAADAEGHRAAPPPVFETSDAPSSIVSGGLAIATTEYSHGDPSDDEQLFLELMNRARLDPSAEADRVLEDYGDADVRSAVRFFLDQRPGVEYTRQENHDAFDALPVVQPLAFNALLSEAAHKHTVIMQVVDLQTHQATGELRLGERVTAEGYEWSGLGESVFAFVKSMVHAHAGFAVDWGQAIDGQTGRPETGHRDSLMAAAFAECGIGVLDDDDPGTNVGPQLITIDFAEPRSAATRFVTGVVYDDANGNDFYDQGEGIPGVRIETDASDFFAISSTSGGYAVPVPANAGNVTVFAGGQADTPGAVVGSQQVTVTMAGRNVKVDFGPLPEPPIPATSAIDGGTQVPLLDGGIVEDVVVVGELDPQNGTVGDLDVWVAVDHDDRSELRLTLVAPSGAELLLFDGAPGGGDLRGAFDTTLRPVEPMRDLVGEGYVGAWTLRVEDAAGGASGGTLERWTLAIRPGWVRDLHAPAAPLTVKALKAKDSSKPGKDKIVLKADIDAGGELVNAEVLGGLRLLNADSGEELVSVHIPLPFDDPDPELPTVKSKFEFHRNGSSRSALVLKVSGLDLPGPLPPVTRVELTFGATIVAEDLAISGGKAVRAAGPRFVVDALKSKAKGEIRSTVVKGRFAGAIPANLSGTAELVVGDARFVFDAADLVSKRTKLVFKSGVGLRKLIVDTAKGTFSAKVESAHSLLVGGKTPVALRLGDAFYGATHILPYDKGAKTLY